jgi:cellulose biosynthesis protein BcsQ/tetratricopeptide (TPR) repeat protein
MPDLSRDGTIVTFYSFKGGTGRTMALANVGWILAANGLHVLAADWDLESPGLYRFFQPFLGLEIGTGPGVLDMIRAYEYAAIKTQPNQREQVIAEQARVQRYASSLNWDFEGGSLDFLSPGSENREYGATLSGLDWDNFYSSLSGGEFLDALRADMKRNYDYVLIDSRTGLSDIADICTLHLPDVVVDCFSLSTQSIEGAARIARVIGELHAYRGIRVLPVPMRVDQTETKRADIGRAIAQRMFADLQVDLSDQERQDYWAAVEVPYQSFYAHEETLAVFEDKPGSSASLLASYERLAAYLTDGAVTQLPAMDERVRNRARLESMRTPPPPETQIIVEFWPEDQIWAEWISAVLISAGIDVRERRITEVVGDENSGFTNDRTLRVVSVRPEDPRQDAPDLAIYVASRPALPGLTSVPSVFLGGVTEQEAVGRLCELTGVAAGKAGSAGHYPGSEPRICVLPARNVGFTGRDENLPKLRARLHDPGRVPVALLGLGGVGKTQIALEYAHRFKSGYDLVWWIDCGQPEFIAASLADLGARMQDSFGLGVPVTATVEEAARHIKQLLQTDLGLRWLLVFDTADQIESVLPYLPVGGGNVLITSRDAEWAEHARISHVDVFTRAESVTYLQRRVPSVTMTEADRLAEALGDLPLAVAAAGEWLAETGHVVAAYLEVLERQGPQALAFGSPTDYPEPVLQAWDLSLNQLEERSPAAARLLEMLSVIAPDVGLGLIYSPAMASKLQAFDPSMSEPMVIGRVMQDISRLALISLLPESNEIEIHRLVQAVVRKRLSSEKLQATREDVHDVLAAARPNGEVDDPETWDRFRLIWPHLTPSLAVRSRAERVRQLFIDRVRYLWLWHDLDRGFAEATEVEATWAELLVVGPDLALQRQFLQLRFNMANILRDQGRFMQAQALDEAVLSDQREVLGADHPHTLMTMGSLAADARALGRYGEALELDRSAHQAWADRYGEDSAQTLVAALHLSVSSLLTGDIVRALQFGTGTLDRSSAVFGSRHPRTLEQASHVARVLVEAGQYAEAVAQMQEVFGSYAEQFGADSAMALNARMLLGIALRVAGRPEEAYEHFASAEVLSLGFVDALAFKVSGSLNLLAMDRIADAEARIREVGQSYEELLGPEHPNTLVCMLDLACVLRSGMQLDRALEAVRPAYEGIRDVLGADHPVTLRAASVLGVLLADYGELDAAERIEADALADMEQVLGTEHPDTLRCRANLILTRQERRGHRAAAERAGVIERLVAVLGIEHPDISALRSGRRLVSPVDPLPR